MAKKSKKYVEALGKIDRTKLYESKEALALVSEIATAKFDETVEAHIKLGVDSRHADQQVRGAIVLPHGTGKTKKVLVFAKGEKAKEAEAAGLDTASGEPNKKKVATLTSAQIREIAELKMPDLNAASVEAAMSMVAGTARSMGIVVED